MGAREESRRPGSVTPPSDAAAASIRRGRITAAARDPADRPTCVCASGGATLKSRTGRWQRIVVWSAVPLRRAEDGCWKTLCFRRFQVFVASSQTGWLPASASSHSMSTGRGPSWDQSINRRAPVPAGLASPQKWLIRPGVRRGSPLVLPPSLGGLDGVCWWVALSPPLALQPPALSCLSPRC